MRTLLLAAAALTVAAPASAAFFDVPVPANAYITFRGLDWAWAAPCSPDPASSCDSSAASFLAFQGGQGWRLPTVAELANRPNASDFVFRGANVPFIGGSDPVSGATFFGLAPSDAACATPYFSSVFRHCDWGDGVAGLINGPDLDETWFVRDGVPTPAPAALALFGLGLAGLALRRR